MEGLAAQHEIKVARAYVVVAEAYLAGHMYAQVETIRRQAERCYEAAESALDGQHMGDLAKLRIELDRIKNKIEAAASDGLPEAS